MCMTYSLVWILSWCGRGSCYGVELNRYFLEHLCSKDRFQWARSKRLTEICLCYVNAQENICSEFFHLHSKGWRIIGYAFYFFVYSSWYGSQGLHLEDVYVEEGCRRMLHVHQCTSCVHVGCDYTFSLSPSLALWSVSLRRRHWYWAYEALCQG